MVCLVVAAFPGTAVVPCPYILSRRSNRATTVERPAISMVIYCEQELRPEHGEQRHRQFGSHASVGQQVQHDEHCIRGSSSSAGAKMPKNYSSLSVENSTAPLPAVPKLILGGIWTDRLLELALAAACHEGAAPRSTSSLRPTWRRSIRTTDSRIS
jgi:hypothetical protein